MSNTVYIVHCIDTEGPLYEDTMVPFEMLNNIFHIKIEPTQENLEKLRNCKIDLSGKEEAVANLLDKSRFITKGTWYEIEEMLQVILSEQYRNLLLDSKGCGWKYNWFCMDHIGFTGMNPRKRDAGYHNIYDYYSEKIRNNRNQDTIQFHHHPVSFSGNYNDSATTYWGRNTLNDILTRRIIDRHWFPAAYRPGFHTERPDSNWFLEQWIPFDYANQAMSMIKSDQPDLSEGRFGDWRFAPIEWRPYHPSHDDYQKEGNCRRWIARCLNMRARLRQIELSDIEEAFARAQNEDDTLLAFTNHDYKDMIGDVDRVRKLIKQVSNKYPDVKFEYTDPVEGMRKVMKIPSESTKLNMTIKQNKISGNQIEVVTNNKIFGPQPFLALKTREGKYYWDNFDFQNGNRWTYTFDENTFTLGMLEYIGVACNSTSGVTDIVTYCVNDKKMEKTILNI